MRSSIVVLNTIGSPVALASRSDNTFSESSSLTTVLIVSRSVGSVDLRVVVGDVSISLLTTALTALSVTRASSEASLWSTGAGTEASATVAVSGVLGALNWLAVRTGHIGRLEALLALHDVELDLLSLSNALFVLLRVVLYHG